MIPPQNVSTEAYARALRRLRLLPQIADEPWRRGTDLVLLSCKRPVETHRLVESLRRNRIALAGIADTWSVDNGSGTAVHQALQEAKFFRNKLWFPKNLGMGAAINEVLSRVKARYVLFIEDDLVLNAAQPFIIDCEQIFREFPQIGIIKLKAKDAWDEKPFRRIGPMQTTTTGVRFHPWLPSPRVSFRWGQRPWFLVGVHNVWSLGPVMFRWGAWKEAGPIPSGQGRGQAIAAEQEYAKRFNLRWIAARPVDIQPFFQPETPESPGFKDVV